MNRAFPFFANYNEPTFPFWQEVMKAEIITEDLDRKGCVWSRFGNVCGEAF